MFVLNQLDLRTGQLCADGQSTLQLHQQRQAVRTSAYTEGLLVVPPDSEIITHLDPVPGGHRCSMIEPDLTITENYGVLDGRILVDTSNWSAKVLVINPGSDVVVFCPRSLVLGMWYRCMW